MVYRDRQGLSPSGDPNQSSKNRDRYLDNCFLLCINRDDDADIPEIHRLENNLMKDLCNKNPYQQQRTQTSENYDFDDEEDFINPRQQKDRDYIYRRKGNQQDKDSQLIKNRSKYQRDDDYENYYNHDQYSRTARFNHRDDYNIMQHNDDELSVYEIYVPTNTLNRLSDKRIDNNMVLIDYEDVSTLHDIRGPSSRNIPAQYNNYAPLNQYNDYGPQYQYNLPRERDGQQQFYQNQQQRFGGYYGNEGDRQPYPPQSGPFLPANLPIDHSNAINVRRHIYSPSQLPQGLTEGQLVMLLQKGSQYQQIKSGQLFPTQNEPQISTASAITVSHQTAPVPKTHTEPFKNPEYVAPLPQNKIAQVPPQIIDHRLADNDKSSIVDEITKPMSALNTRNSLKPSKESEEKIKDNSSDLKKDKKAEKDIGDSNKKESKKDGKKEKSSGKDGKKKKKKSSDE